MSENVRQHAASDDGGTLDGDPPPRDWTEPATAASLLRAAALVAVVIWVVGFVATVWFQWSQLERMTLAGQRSPDRFVGAVASGFTSTWGYLLVAVVALTAATVLGSSGTQAADRATQ